MQLGIGLGLGFGGAPKWTPAALALFARMSTPPTPSRAALINSAIASLQASGVWSKLDVLHVLAASDSQAALLNWKADAFNPSAVNSPTFAADRGYTGNGSSSYVDSGFNPSSASGSFARDSAYFGIWSRTSAQKTTSAAGWFDGTSGITIFPRNTSDLVSVRINQAAAATAANTNGSGLIATSRDGASTLYISRNGSRFGSVTGATTASVALVNANLRYGSITAASFSDVQIAAGAVGGYLSPTEEAALYSALNAYMTAVGAA